MSVKCAFEMYRVELAIVLRDGRDLSHCERRAAVDLLGRRGKSAAEIASTLQIAQRLVTRYRGQNKTRPIDQAA